MADPPTNRESGDDTGAPRWVKVFGLIALVLVVVFVIVHLAGGGFRHHMRHGDTPPSSITDGGNPQR